jgi:hypothetical protein
MTSREDRNAPTVGAGAIFRMLQRGRPTENAFWPSGEPGPDIENGENPVTITGGDTGYEKIQKITFKSMEALILQIHGLKD